MTSRLCLRGPINEIEASFQCEWPHPFADRFNISPGSPLQIVREQMNAGITKREMALVRWGLVPAWLKSGQTQSTLVVARAETVAEKPSFKFPLTRRRCLVPASGFYEWMRLSNSTAGSAAKLPHYIQEPSGAYLGLAGIWEYWQGADGSEMETACLLTQPARGELRQISERSPIIVPVEQWADWLNPSEGSGYATQLLSSWMMREEGIELLVYPVSHRINSVDSHGAELIQRLP